MDKVNSSPENLALRRQLLQARSRLFRLGIRHELHGMHETLARPARLLAFASSVVLLARLAGIALRLVRKS